MRKLGDLIAVLEKYPSQWSRTQSQMYVDSMLSTLIAFAERKTVAETKFIMLARLNAEIKRKKDQGELSDGGEQIYSTLSKDYRRMAKSVLSGSFSDYLWSKLDVPKATDLSKQPKGWPKALREIYRTGAIALALHEKQIPGFVPALSIRKVENDVLKFMPQSRRTNGRRSTFNSTWKVMNPVAHFCAGILKVIPPNSGEVLSSESRPILASRIVELIEQSDNFYRFLGSAIDEKGKRLVSDQISLTDPR